MRRFVIFLVPLIFTTACTLSLVDLPALFGQGPTPTPLQDLPPTPTPLPQAEVTFRVRIPADTPAGEQLYLTVLDEVTGLALNPQSNLMRLQGVNLFSVTLRAGVGSVIKYRYSRQGPGTLTASEHISDGRAVRYRMYRVDGPGSVEDIISRWNDTQFQGPSGRIIGQVSDASSGAGIPGVLVSAGGAQTLSAADGSFLLEGLPPGTHNLVAHALDGSHHTYQQGAIVAEGATTPAPLRLVRAAQVQVTFTVIVPQDTIPGVPVRLAGNLVQLGNTFSDLAGGMTTLSTRMPQLSLQPENRYSISMSLPAGTDVRYKYTLGDGFWNAEHNARGDFVVRQLIVPDNDHSVVDRVTSWHSGDSQPILFDVTVPVDTPSGDTVSLQFNPYGWTEPVPMWSLGNNRWVYRLTSPLNMLGTIGYRYCRNQQCGSADDALTAGDQSGGRPVITSRLPQNLQDAVSSWQWMDPPAGPITVPSVEIRARGAAFVAGVELQTGFHPSWSPRLPTTLSDIRGLRANWVILTPTWNYTRLSPPVLETVPGRDPLWTDLTAAILQARQSGLAVALRPIPVTPGPEGDWWAAAPRDARWWDLWFERYRLFALHHAALATQHGAQTLILGGPEVSPALPGGLLADGESSGAPADADNRWRTLLEDIRGQFSGTLAWALPYPQGLENPPDFMNEVDLIYLLWSAQLASRADASPPELEAEAARLLDSQVLVYQAELNKPLILSIAYPSADGGITACIPATGGGCLDLAELSRPQRDNQDVQLDLMEQVDAYNALLSAVNQRNWISGVVTRGYYPPAALRDKSISVHGKPAGDLLSFWFPRLLGEP